MPLLKPPVVRQPLGSVKCWAAAMESWLKVTHHPPNILNWKARWAVTQDDLVKLYTCNNSKLCSGAADTELFVKTIAPDVGMETEILQSRKLHHLYVSLVLNKGHMYLAFEKPGKYTHCTVVYGIELQSNPVVASGASEFFLRTMDPQYGYMERPISDMDGCKMVVGWPIRVES